jgi:hypothetical protein
MKALAILTAYTGFNLGCMGDALTYMQDLGMPHPGSMLEEEYFKKLRKLMEENGDIRAACDQLEHVEFIPTR